MGQKGSQGFHGMELQSSALVECSTHPYTLGSSRLESNSAENLGVLMDSKVIMNQQHASSAKQVNSILGFIRKSIASRLRKVDVSLQGET